MRLIDADALIDELEESRGSYIGARHDVEEHDAQCDFAISYIECAQTVDPVKHGKWRGYTCTRFYGIDEDGEPKWRDGGTIYYHRKCGWRSAIKTPHCPRCGRKMDLRMDDNETD